MTTAAFGVAKNWQTGHDAPSWAVRPRGAATAPRGPAAAQPGISSPRRPATRPAAGWPPRSGQQQETPAPGAVGQGCPSPGTKCNPCPKRLTAPNRTAHAQRMRRFARIKDTAAAASGVGGQFRDRSGRQHYRHRQRGSQESDHAHGTSGMAPGVSMAPGTRLRPPPPASRRPERRSGSGGVGDRGRSEPAVRRACPRRESARPASPRSGRPARAWPAGA
jgi:hypothetical protein